VRPASPLHTLRVPVADFTGRAQEVGALLTDLRGAGEAAGGDVALISGLRGMGGVGKTELALSYPSCGCRATLDGETAYERLGEVLLRSLWRGMDHATSRRR
jgi:hypothetical protein